jgi:hypothetical protein
MAVTQAQEGQIEQLTATVDTLKGHKSALIDSADKFGLNLRPIIDAEGLGDLFMPTALDLAAAFAKPIVRTAALPDYEQAKSHPALSEMMFELSNKSTDETQIRRQYEYFRPLGRQFIVIDNQ